jgi:hypothetical protein
MGIFKRKFRAVDKNIIIAEQICGGTRFYRDKRRDGNVARGTFCVGHVSQLEKL